MCTLMTIHIYMCARESMALETWHLGYSLLFVLWETMWHLLMTSDFSVSAKTMRMVLKVSDRVLIAHCVSLSPYIGGKPFLFFFILFCFLTLQYCISFAIYQQEFATGQKKWSSHHGQQKSLKCSTWVQPQKWQNDLSSFPRQVIQHQSNPSLAPIQ